MSALKNENPAGAVPPAPEQFRAEAAKPVNPMVDALADPHAALIAEYQNNVQWNQDPLAAVVASENAKLFAFVNKYQSLVDATLASANTLADLKDMDFAIKRRLDLHRQNQMYSQLSFKLEKSASAEKPEE